MPDMIRHPWIAGAETPDPIRGRNDMGKANSIGPGPYGQGGGSRKYVLASLDQSLARMGLEYVDIFCSHRVDPDTPLEQTMGALASAVRQGKALYVGISSHSAGKTREAAALLQSIGVPCLTHQPCYSLLDR